MREPASPDKEQIQRRIEALKRQIAAEKATPVAPPVATTAVTTPPPPAEPPPSADAQSGKRSPTPLIVAGAGGALLIVGLVIYVPAAKDVKDSEDQCPNRKCLGPDEAQNTANAKKGEDARKKAVLGGVVSTVGVAAVAGGLIWYFAQPKKAATTATLLRPNVTPSVAPGFAGVALSGAF